ncbi:hypothetical protein CEUSTIGMA_g9560.t1 [Chlamydomonas eustigma]|uniref:cyclin-dependent kinase n=1 Tax=Chlamydomonas eustigma TaxID=1157962 RepID=A0A250XGT5_9CHLO|nr:hypothetical protein CEUSTIGMA_g9560.t1 [Chlamydomonas eustigma]|eukprot:GAX82132.1 hypothetical protein CEUSTIGMA_g9560.t1 [Chlamydomonas eustigma]
MVGSMTCSSSDDVNDQFVDFVKVGEGTYGVVYCAKSKHSGENFAIKEIKQDNNEEGIQSSALREISLLMDLDHPNVLKLHQVISDRHHCKVWMVLEYLDMDLWKMLHKHPLLLPAHPELVKYYMWQLLQGLGYCHSRRVIHRDIKPQNLLIHLKRNQIKICDFGLARAVGMPLKALSPEVITIWYRPPELLLASSTYSAAIDMWSVGCILYEMTTSKPLFPGMTEIDQLGKIFRVTGVPDDRTWPGVTKLSGYRNVGLLPQIQPQAYCLEQMMRGSSLSPAGMDLLHSLLMLDPNKRPSARKALNHPYFQDIASILRDPPVLI